MYHDVPLITSVDRNKVCSCCNRKAILTCPKIGCNSKICKNCFEELDVEEEYTVQHNVEEVNDEMDSDFDCSEDEMSQQSSSNNKNSMTEDLFNDYLTSSQDLDLSGDDNESVKYQYDESNSGECVLNVREENRNRGAYKDITVSGSTIMNQCGSLLTRKKHQIRGSWKQKFFIQKLCAISRGTSVPLIYAEAMLFPSIFWKASGDMNSLVGALPAPLLNKKLHHLVLWK